MIPSKQQAYAEALGKEMPSLWRSCWQHKTFILEIWLMDKNPAIHYSVPIWIYTINILHIEPKLCVCTVYVRMFVP